MPLLRVLFLDDDPQRHRIFRRTLRVAGDHFAVHLDAVHTHDEAITSLTTHSYDAVFLDHDLSIEAAAGGAPEDEKTGYDVAVFIAALPEEKRPRFCVIHSFNPTGAARMATVLAEANVEVLRHPFSERLGGMLKTC